MTNQPCRAEQTHPNHWVCDCRQMRADCKPNLASQSAAEELPPIAPVAWADPSHIEMLGPLGDDYMNVKRVRSDKFSAPLYAAPPSAVLLEVLEAMELLAELHDAMGAPQGPARAKVAAAIAKLREWMGEKG